ncbi:MAG: hypothetical protein GEU73_07955 [Chloroflexi bacterium]|nr:hypothetical protein [Chloroflexota bacterium]
MSTNLGPTLPADLVELFSGRDLGQRTGHAYLLVTHGQDGYPHPCIVTPGELVAGDATTLRVALYAESTATRNLRAGSGATLCLVHDGAAWYVKMDPEALIADAPAFEGQAVFTLRTRHVLKDVEPPAEMTSGLGFRIPGDEEAVLARWERMVHALRETFPDQSEVR